MSHTSEPELTVVATSPSPGLTQKEMRTGDLLWASGMVAMMVALFVAIRLSRGALAPILLSFVLAYALDPLAEWLESKGFSRTLASLVLFLVMGLTVVGALLFLLPAVGSGLSRLPGFFDGIIKTALPRVERVIGQPLPANIREAAVAFGQRGGGFAQEALPKLASVAEQAISTTAGALLFSVGMLMVPVLGFFLLKDLHPIIAFAKSLIPPRYESLVSGRFHEVHTVLSGFIRGQLTVGAILTWLYSIGLSIARLDFAVPIGAVAGFGTMIPYVGPGIGMILAVISLMVCWQGSWQLVVVAATFAGSMTLEGLFITPRIVGGKVGLSPVAVMMAILFFGDFFGFAGVLLAVPVTATLKVVAKVVLLHYRRCWVSEE